MKVPMGPVVDTKPSIGSAASMAASSAPTQTDLLMAAATMHSAGRLFEKPPEPKPTDDK